MASTCVENLMAGPLVAWFASCIEAEEEPLTYDSLVDGILIHHVIRQMKLDIQHSVIKRSENKPEIRLTNLDAILRCLQNYIEIDLGYMLLVVPNISDLAKKPIEHVAEMELLLKLLISCSVLCPNSHIFTRSMMGFDIFLQEQLKDLIDEVICKPGILLHQDMLLPDPEKQFNEKHIDNCQLAFDRLRRLYGERNEYLDRINLMTASTKNHDADESKESNLNESILAMALPASPSPHEIPPRPMRRQGKVLDLRSCDNYASDFEACQKELDELRFKNEVLESELKKAKIACNDKIDALLEKADKANRLEADVLRYQRKLEDFETCRSQLQEVTEERNRLLECQQLLMKQLNTLQKSVTDQNVSSEKIVASFHEDYPQHPDADRHCSMQVEEFDEEEEEFLQSQAEVLQREQAENTRKGREVHFSSANIEICMQVEENNEEEEFLHSQVNELQTEKAKNTPKASERHISSAHIEIGISNNDDGNDEEVEVAQKSKIEYGSNIENKICRTCVSNNNEDNAKKAEVDQKLEFEYSTNIEDKTCTDCEFTVLNLKQQIANLEDKIEDKNYEAYMMENEVQKLKYKCNMIQKRNSDLEKVKVDLENFSTSVINDVRIHTLESQDRYFTREREYQQMVARLDQAKTLLERKLIDSYDDICKGSSRRKRESLGANIVRKSVSRIRRVSELFSRSRKSSSDEPSVKGTYHDLSGINEFECTREKTRRMSTKIELGMTAMPESFVSDDFANLMQKFEPSISSTPYKFTNWKEDSHQSKSSLGIAV